jgi:hypothetical protein
MVLVTKPRNVYQTEHSAMPCHRSRRGNEQLDLDPISRASAQVTPLLSNLPRRQDAVQAAVDGDYQYQNF